MPRTKLDKKKPTTKESREIMTLYEFMSYIRVGYPTAIKLLTTEIPCRHINREWRVRKKDVDDWLSRRPEQSTKEEPSC